MRYRAFLRHGLEKDVAGRLIRVYNRAAGSGAGSPPDAVTISEIETPGPGILLEGSFGCDVQKLVQLCYNYMSLIYVVDPIRERKHRCIWRV